MSIELDKRFSRFLSRNKGRVIVAEQYYLGKGMDEPEGGWQRYMSSRITRSKNAGRLKACGIVRDHRRGYKTKWRVVA